MADESKIFESIDKQDTVNELIRKLEHNFRKIEATGIFDEKNEEENEDHDYLCDALLIKPHQPIHRRKRILEPLENRKDISWLSDVDFLLGDVAIIEQKRPEDTSSTRVFMYTIAKAKEDSIFEFELISETELTGPTGKSAEIYLTYESQEIFENTFFNKLNVDKLNVNSLSIINEGTLTSNAISTNRLTIGNLTFENTGEESVLGTNLLKVGRLQGFMGDNDTIYVESQIVIDQISSGDPDRGTVFENPIQVNKITANTEDNKSDIIYFGSPIQSTTNELTINSPVKLNRLNSTGSEIVITPKIRVNTISSHDSKNLTIGSPLIVNSISSSGETTPISINSPIASDGLLSFKTKVKFNESVELDENVLKFKQFDYSDKFKTHGQVFLAIKDLLNINVLNSIDETDNLSKYGTPYSYIPLNNDMYGIAKVTYDGSDKYMLIQKSTRTSKGTDNRMFTTRTDANLSTTNITSDETIYELIASNDVYKNIFESLKSSTTSIYTTIGFTKPTSFITKTGCEITVKPIGKLDSALTLSERENQLIYYITLY